MSINEYRFESVEDELSLASLEADWDGLVRAMPRPSPFLLHGWVLEWWRHYSEGAELATEVAFRDGRLVAALPVIIRKQGRMRVAEFLGGSESALADLIVKPGEDSSVGERLLNRFEKRRPDIVDFFGLPADSHLSGLAGHRIRIVPRADAPVLDLKSPWEVVYREKTTTRERNHNSRRRKQLDRVGQVEITLAREGSALALALEDALYLHQARWAGRRDGSSFGTVLGKSFHRAAMRRLAPMDVIRIVLLKLDGQPIAFNYYFVLCGRMYGHRQAFDPKFARFSPGMVCMLAAIESAASEGVTRVEFLGGREQYKLQFADRSDPIYEAIGLPSSVSGAAAAIVRLGSIAIRRRLARSRSIHNLYYEGIGLARKRAVRLVERTRAHEVRPL